MVNRPRKYGLSSLAVTDLEGIWRYTVENWSVRRAEIYHAEIVEAFEGLASGLKIGRATDIRDGYFKYAVGSHVIYYLLRNGEIAIIRILQPANGCRSASLKRCLASETTVWFGQFL